MSDHKKKIWLKILLFPRFSFSRFLCAYIIPRIVTKKILTHLPKLGTPLYTSQRHTQIRIAWILTYVELSLPQLDQPFTPMRRHKFLLQSHALHLQRLIIRIIITKPATGEAFRPLVHVFNNFERTCAADE